MNKDNYIRLYDADTTGLSYNSRQFFGTIVASPAVTSNKYVKMIVNGTDYYIRVYTGAVTSNCCTNLTGITASSGTFTGAGFICVRVEGNLKFMEIYTKT